MRWGFKRETVVARTEWTGRFGAAGARLDLRRAPLSGIALIWNGSDVWITGLELVSGRHEHAWFPLFDGFNESTSVSAAVPGEWSLRFRQIGQVLDQDGRDLRDPCLVPVAGGYLVTGLAMAGDGGTQWELASWRVAGS